MADIVALHGNTVPGEPVADVVDMLADMLIRAQKGEISAIAVATYNAGSDELGTAWSGTGGTRNALGTGVAMLQHRFIAGVLAGPCCNG